MRALVMVCEIESDQFSLCSSLPTSGGGCGESSGGDSVISHNSVRFTSLDYKRK